MKVRAVLEDGTLLLNEDDLFRVDFVQGVNTIEVELAIHQLPQEWNGRVWTYRSADD